MNTRIALKVVKDFKKLGLLKHNVALTTEQILKGFPETFPKLYEDQVKFANHPLLHIRIDVGLDKRNDLDMLLEFLWSREAAIKDYKAWKEQTNSIVYLPLKISLLGKVQFSRALWKASYAKYGPSLNKN